MPAEPPPGLRHDLLNALNAINGYASLLQMDLPEGPLRMWAGRILEAAQEAVILAGSIPTSRPCRGRRLLLVAGEGTGDALELELDQLEWDMVRARDWTEAGTFLAEAPGAVDAIVADPDLPGRPQGLRIVDIGGRWASPVSELAQNLDRHLRSVVESGSPPASAEG